MSAQRVEIQHHTPEQVLEYVRLTREMLDGELGVGNWDGATFAAVVGLIASKSINVVQPQPLNLGGVLPGGNNLLGLR